MKSWRAAKSAGVQAAPTNAGAWTLDLLPNLTGKHAVVTGSSGGIGFQTALELGRRGATVTVLSRSLERSEMAATEMHRLVPNGSYEFGAFNLADLDSIDDFAQNFNNRKQPIDLLVNNAAVFGIPSRELTVDGFELNVGVNFLGHFALTALLKPSLKLSQKPRVVNVLAQIAEMAKLDKTDLMAKNFYGATPAYATSKALQMFFSYELAKRAGQWLEVASAHPGFCKTNIHEQHWLGSGLFTPFKQTAASGAMCVLRACGEPRAGGMYYHPGGVMQSWGAPLEYSLPAVGWKMPASKNDDEATRQVWEMAEDWSEIRFNAQ